MAEKAWLFTIWRSQCVHQRRTSRKLARSNGWSGSLSYNEENCSESRCISRLWLKLCYFITLSSFTSLQTSGVISYCVDDLTRQEGCRRRQGTCPKSPRGWQSRSVNFEVSTKFSNHVLEVSGHTLPTTPLTASGTSVKASSKPKN